MKSVASSQVPRIYECTVIAVAAFQVVASRLTSTSIPRVRRACWSSRTMSRMEATATLNQVATRQSFALPVVDELSVSVTGSTDVDHSSNRHKLPVSVAGVCRFKRICRNIQQQTSRRHSEQTVRRRHSSWPSLSLVVELSTGTQTLWYEARLEIAMDVAAEQAQHRPPSAQLIGITKSPFHHCPSSFASQTR